MRILAKNIFAGTRGPAIVVLSTLGVLTPAWAQVVTTCPSGFVSSRLFTGTGAVQTFVVPAQVTSIRVIAVGADGGERNNGKACGGSGYSGGAGARIEGTYAVTPGQTISLLPGSPGASGNCESGGGGATGVYIAGNLAIIAGAGGGDDNTGKGGGGQAGLNGSNGYHPGGHCGSGGLAGTGGNGGAQGETPPKGSGSGPCPSGDGGAGGGGFLTAGTDEGSNGSHLGPTGGGRCNILGAVGGNAGKDNTSNAGSPEGAAGGWGVCGGGGSDDRESGGGGGYSGGGGGPESGYPGGGGSIVQNAGAAVVSNTATTAGADGGGTGQVGSVRLCWPGSDLSVTKTDFVASKPSGSTTTYQIQVKNAGPLSANGAVVTDPVVPGLSCTTAPTCSAAGGAVCPTPLSVATLQTSGLVIPTFPSGGSITLGLTCTVTATGF